MRESRLGARFTDLINSYKNLRIEQNKALISSFISWGEF